jgi:hypothetical protein
MNRVNLMVGGTSTSEKNGKRRQIKLAQGKENKVQAYERWVALGRGEPIRATATAQSILALATQPRGKVTSERRLPGDGGAVVLDHLLDRVIVGVTMQVTETHVRDLPNGRQHSQKILVPCWQPVHTHLP